MNRFIAGIAVLLLTVLTMALLPPRVPAGSGIITDKGNGSVVNLTVYFDDKSQDQQLWKANILETHKMLWTATRGLVRLGEIRLGTDPSVKGRADIRIDKIGHASVSQPDDRERTSLGTGDVLYLFEEDMKHPIITVHELGHYLFCLSDEYKSDVWAIQNGVAQVVDKGNEEVSWCSVERASPRASTVNPNHSCVMYDNDTPNIYYLFCAEEHLKRNDFPDGRWAVTRQQRDNKMSCLHTIAASLGITTLPGLQIGDPPDLPTIITLKPEKRVGILIQADLPGTALQKARNVAAATVKRLRLPGAGRNGDSVGVATFAASVGVIQDWKTLETQSDIDAVVGRINGIPATSGSANLEAALRAEMTAIIGSGYRYAAQTILLITNTPGTVSQALINELRRNDVVVDVISDNSALKGLAVQTGGDFTFMNSLNTPSGPGRAPLAARSADEGDDDEESDGAAAAAITDGYLIARFAGTLQPGQPISHDLPVDALNDGITVDFGSGSGGPVTLVLKNPAGAVDLDNPPVHVQVQRTASRVLVRIGEPDPGTWTAQVDGAAAAAYTLELSGSGDAMGEADLPSLPATFPAATRLYLTVENGMVVTGCQVQAVVTRPDKTKVTLPLYDDGNLALHGDAQADDGVYTAFFTQYTGSGVYRVEFQINNTTGQYSTAFAGANSLPDDLSPGPVGPAPPFQRILYDSFSVEGVPAAGGTALLAPGNLTLRSEAPGQVTLSWIDTNEGLSQTVVQRNSGGGYQTIAVVDAGQILYTDTAAGTTGQLSYRLLSRTAAGDSQPCRPGEIDTERAAAALTAKLLTVTKTGTGSGVVTASPGNLGWSGAVGSGMVDLGTAVSLTAIPDNRSVFTGWSGEGCSGAASCNVTMNAARSVLAGFRNILKGDIDDNLTVNLADAILTLQIISGVIPPGTVYRSQADVSGDRKIGTADALYILQFVAGMRPDYQVLARVEVPTYLEDLNLDVYADLEDAAGTYYALVIATKRQLDNAGVTYRIIDEFVPGTSYLIALEDVEGARKEAAGLVNVLYDDGEHIIVRYRSELSELLPDIGFDLKLMSQTPTVYNPVAPGTMARSPLAAVSFPIVQNTRVETMLAKVTEENIKLATEQLSGEKQVTVDGALETISSRHTYREGTKVQKATQYVYDRLNAMGLTPSFADWTVEYGEGFLSNRNVVGEIRGQSAPEEIVLLIAHLDTVSKALDGIEPGADDNASGCVGLLTAADIMRAYKFKRTVRFVFTTGEEQSLYGGKAYAKKADDERQKIVAVLNLDMIGYSKKTDPPSKPKQQIKIRNAKNRTGNAKDLPIAQAYIDVVKTYGMDQVFEAVIEDDGEVTSDHAPFWDLMADCMKRDPLEPCYPAAWIIEYAEEGFLNPKMHGRNDRVNIMNLPYYEAVVKAALGTAAHLAETMD